MKISLTSPPLLALSLAIAACSSEPDETAAIDASTPRAAAVPDTAAPAAPASNAQPSSESTVPVLGLEGFDDLRIGEAVPEGSAWAERGAQASDTCRTISSPDFPGAYAIVAGGEVRRITLGQRSDVKLAEGIGVGASEGEVTESFGGFGEEPHKYVEAPGKYLTAPNAASGEPALRFEIGRDGKVSLIHVGVMPELAYVEGCA
jgi:hypothetical protein